MFHVPHQYRIRKGLMGSDDSYGNNGAFLIPPKIPGRELWIIASDGYEFEHVSVHAANARNKQFIPCWEEMCYIKDLFWDAEDAVMQLHPPRSTWVNTHAYTLHLWRPLAAAIPLPPDLLVGIRGLEVHP
jgi:hypothetical protein